MKVGDVIRVIRMDDSNGKDPAVHKMNDVISVITHIDDMGQIHIYGFTYTVTVWQLYQGLTSLRY